MTTRKSPLTSILTIEVVGDGTLTQSQDTARNLWQPNRDPSAGGVSPLILKPNLQVTDAWSGQPKTVTPTYTWYIDEETSSWDSTNEKGRVSVLGGQGDDLYYLETNNGTSSGTPTGRLVVRKNVDYLIPKKVILKATYIDAQSGETYNDHAEVVLSSQNRPEDFYSVKLQCPSTIQFNPLEPGSSLMTVRAVAALGRADVSSLVKFFWYLNGTIIPTDNTLPLYQTGNQLSGKGQGTDTIVIDLDTVDMGTLSVAVGDSLTAVSPLDYANDCCTLAWDLPSLELIPLSKGAKHVKEEDTQKGFGSVIHADGVDLDATKRAEYIRQQWWTKASNTTTKTMGEWGEETVIPASQLKRSGNVNVDVNADMYLLGPMEVLTDDYGDPLTDDSGSTTASAFGGLTVGRG